MNRSSGTQSHMSTLNNRQHAQNTFASSRAGHSSMLSQPNQTSIMNHLTTARGYNDQVKPGQ